MTTDLTSRSALAPYISAWSAEELLPCLFTEIPGRGIAYADERVIDRDEHGVLWARMSWAPRQGRPVLGQVHPLRHRQAMRRLHCQVCNSPADQTADGVLWLLPDHRDDRSGWPEGIATTEPPVCLPCVRVASRACPALRRGAVAVRAGRYPVVAVRGGFYVTGRVPQVIGDELVALTDSRIRWVLAHNLVRQLHDCTLIKVGDLSTN
ncbi:hypothetical protein [Labedaea rhizosphaerae]|uniref:hypothetical protein n=1 Tax=Labedaea rhizosphaerae TaxID=598644 RepID=UPI0010601BB0|nr:hypothetical protein [Labedaea rhizosphaerae]